MRLKSRASFCCRLGAVAWLGATILVADIAGAQEVRVEQMPPGGTVATFSRVEWRIDPGRIYDNPFDPAQVSVDGLFTDPDGKTLTLPAFWEWPGDTTGTAGRKGAGAVAGVTAGAGTFVLRFAAPRAGNWALVVQVTDANGRRTSGRQSFSVTTGSKRGFVRRAGNNRYFRFDSGDSYFPVGLNLAWSSDGPPQEWFPAVFATLVQNGGNFARVWMCNPQVMLESSKTGLGRYDLQSAALFDTVLNAADRNGIEVMLCFMNHRELLNSDMWGPGQWPGFPYNAANGGPATRPGDFFSDARARKFFKARLRYIVARYTAYTSLGFWEIFNEQELTRVPVSVDWNAEITGYLRQIDPYQHLITTSAGVGAGVWKLPEMELTQSHLYGDGTQIDVILPAVAAAQSHRQFGKPHLIGEMGISYKGPDTAFDPSGKGTSFHNGLWAGMFSGSAGTCMYWWWDNFIEPKNLWHEFGPVAKFAADVDWAHADYQPIRLSGPWREKAVGGDVDLVLSASGRWGEVARDEIVVPKNGRPESPVPAYLYGPVHPDLQSPLTIGIDLPRETKIVLHVSRVSDYAMLRLAVDGKPVSDFGLSALPNSPGVTHSDYRQENHVYQSDVNSDLTAAIPAGKHKITITVIAGDWVILRDITFAGSLAAKYAYLGGLALQDHASGNTLAWVFDTRSNWKDDQTDGSPPAEDGVKIGIPGLASGTYEAQWVDTRTGKVVQSERVTADADGDLVIDVPKFSRDIAVRINSAK
jgi:hypothetical protein